MADDPTPEDATRFAPPEVLDALMMSTADAIYLVDHAGLVRYANPAALDLLGYSAEQLLGRDSHATIHHHYRDGRAYPADQCPLLRPRTTGESVRVEEDWFVRRDGTLVPVAYSSAPITTDDGRGAVVIFRDITARREADEARRREASEQARVAELRASRARILAATDAERRRIGRNIHDGAQQRLMNVALGIQQGTSLVPTDPVGARQVLDAALTEVRETLVDLRDLAAGIHPSILTNRGLAAAVDAITAHTPFPVSVAIPEQRFPATVESAAYFTVAEALANVTKHAQATRAAVAVTDHGDHVTVRIDDDGRGGATVTDGRGLQGLRDRVQAAGGELDVDAGPEGRGTAVTATLPSGG